MEALGISLVFGAIVVAQVANNLGLIIISTLAGLIGAGLCIEARARRYKGSDQYILDRAKQLREEREFQERVEEAKKYLGE